MATAEHWDECVLKESQRAHAAQSIKKMNHFSVVSENQEELEVAEEVEDSDDETKEEEEDGVEEEGEEEEAGEECAGEEGEEGWSEEEEDPLPALVTKRQTRQQRLKGGSSG